MGLIHSRASKQRDRAEAELLHQEAKAAKAERQEARLDQQREEAGDSLLRQPTVGDVIKTIRRRRRAPEQDS